MNNKQLKNRLGNAVNSMVPADMYSRILNGLDMQERTQRMNNIKKTTNHSLVKRIAAIAAVVCLMFGMGYAGSNIYAQNYKVDSIIDIDVNPGIEIYTNAKDKVLKTVAVNQEAETVLEGMNLKGTDLNVAVNAIIGSMVQNGYLKIGENNILVTVVNNDTKKAEEIKTIVVADINNTLKTENITATVANQTLTKTDTAENFAKKHGISYGKAALILNLCEKDSSLNSEELAKMSLREIAKIVGEKDIDISDLLEYEADDSIWENIHETVEELDENKKDNELGNNNTSVDLTKDEAIDIALADAGVAKADVTALKAELDRDDGRYEYDIEFNHGGYEYDYTVNAQTGKITERDMERDEDASQAPNEPTAEITKEQAMQIALDHAGIKVSVLSSVAPVIKIELDDDDGRYEYDIEIKFGGYEYDYTIDASNGEILDFDKELADDYTPLQGTTITLMPEITRDEAINIALSHAGVSKSEATRIKAEFDIDDGRQEYEVEFKVGRTEYDYTINANTGAIIEFDKEIDD